MILHKALGTEETESGPSQVLVAGTAYVISKVLVRGITYLTTPIFTRLLTTQEYGDVATFGSWCSLLTVICSLSLSASIGRAKLDYPDKLDRYIGSITLLSLCVTGAVAIPALLMLNQVSKLLNMDASHTICLLAYLTAAAPISFYQDGCRFRYRYRQNLAIAWYNAAATVGLSLILILWFPIENTLARLLGLTLPSVLLALLLLRKTISAGNLKYNGTFWRYGLNISIPMVFHSLSMTILGMSDRLLISNICGSSDVALYSLAYSIGALNSVLMDGLNGAWNPWFHDTFFAGEFDKLRKNATKLTLFVCFLVLALTAFAPELVALFGGEKYRDSAYCIVPVSIGVLCQFIYGHYVNIEIHKKKTLFVAIATFLAAILNITLNALYIPRYGFIAAAYTTLFSYFFLMLAHFATTHWILKCKVYDDALFFLMLVLTGIICFFLMRLYPHFYVRLCLAAIGFIVFVLCFRDYATLAMAGLKRKGDKRN